MFNIFNISKPNKKASLNLSINAIVIIVLAMTLMGLGLGFIRGMFGKISGISEATFEKIAEQLNTDLATSEAPLLFSKSRTTMERGATALEGVGVRNDADSSITYGIKIITANCPERKTDPEAECTNVEGWFEYFKGDSQYTLSAAQRQVNKVQINVPRTGISTGLYLLKIITYEGIWPAEGECVEEACLKLGQTEFFLTVA